MYFFYVDESGNTGANLDSADQPIHWLVALGLSPWGVRGVERRMAEIAGNYFRERARRPDFEFHGNEIFSGRGECRDLTPAQRVGLYGEILQLIGEHKGAIFVRGINKPAHRDRAVQKQYKPDHPHRLGFMYLVERLDEWLENLQPVEDIFEQGSGPIYGLIVADEQREVGRDIIESFAFWRDRGTDHGYRARDIYYLIDTVHYVPSHDSWLIQLVDCIAYMRNRYDRVFREVGWNEDNWSQSDKAVVRLWREHCQPHVDSDRVWP